MPKSGPRTIARYSDEFKATAVRLSELPGVLVQDVAASLYIHPFMRSRWRKWARDCRGSGGVGRAQGAAPGEEGVRTAEGRA